MGYITEKEGLSKLCKLKKPVWEANLRAEKGGREENVTIAVPLKCDLISGLGKSKTCVSAEPSTTVK